ncbi:hypothetical protein PMAYCL1PPCAC_29653 [Pristionchus mayeri]|uniref:Uncharacterized protein n=1 Tax=Pristionchus mayeri TaxID=1317129 RepID=A0AAN5IB21_9BILA|nr:hypothetical protein PMAYCL1PPCAC_29653 [Pristionchus mayeri]
MFARKKDGVRIDFDQDFGTVNSARTYNVRRHEPWPSRILYNVDTEDATADQDEHDKQQQYFFDCNAPQSNNVILFGPTTVLPPARQIQAMKLIGNLPSNLELELIKLGESGHRPHTIEERPNPFPFNAEDNDAIELSDDGDADISTTGKIKKRSYLIHPFTKVQQNEHKGKVDQLSVFMGKKGITETNTQKIEGEKENGDCFISELIDNLEEKYLEVGNQPNRKKTTFMLRPEDPTFILDLVDSSVSKKMVGHANKKRFNSRQSRHRNREDPSTGIRIQSGVEFQVVAEKVDPTFKSGGGSPSDAKTYAHIPKKMSPSPGPKRAPVGKYAKRGEYETSKIAVHTGETFVPRKENKLRSTNVNDFLRNSDMHKKKVPIIQRERKEKGDGVIMVNVKKKDREGDVAHIGAEKLRIPRKEQPLPPLADSTFDQGEPLKKKTRASLPCEPSIDILGSITDAMDAAAAENAPRMTGVREPMNMSPRRRCEEWALPRMHEEPMAPPSLPPRFIVEKDDAREEMMEISNSSPETSPRPSEEKSVSNIPSVEEEKEKKTGRWNELESHRTGGCREVRVKGLVSPLCMGDKSRLGDLYSAEAVLVKNSPTMINRPKPAVSYRLMEVDNVKKFAPAAKRSDSFVDIAREIPLDKKDLTVTDPRIPAPSLALLSSWNKARVEINLGCEEAVATKDKDNGKAKKKGVQWGETATKEFNPDDEEMGPIEIEKKNNETAKMVVGEKEVGGRKYRIVKKVTTESAPPKSCLKPSMNVSTASFRPGVDGSVTSFIRPPTTPPTEEYKEAFPLHHINPLLAPSASSIGRTPRLPDFVPPPGYEIDMEKKKKEEREKKEAEEKKRKEREAREKKEMEEKKKREMEELEKRDREEKKKKEVRYKENGGSSFSSPEAEVASSSKMPNTFVSTRYAHINQGRASASSSYNSMPWSTTTSSRPIEKGSDIIGDRAPMQVLKGDVAKYQLEMRSKVAGRLMVHKTMRDGPVKEYPSDREHPSIVEQHQEQDTYYRELTMIEKDWKRNGIQPVWMQALPYQTQFSFERDAGLYWPVVQATDRINESESDFQSMDVLRSLGDNTHFATEKRTLLGVDTRLPNGMTHKERFESFMKGGKTEGRFKNRPMYSRVFSTQSEEEARAIHNERMEDERRLLREHEEVMKKNAPQGVSIAPCQMTIDRPAGFRDFPNMIQYYKQDDYETDTPFQDPDWYCNNTDYYMPYTERANYLCSVINHFNRDYNALYENSKLDNILTDLDKAAFAASQIYLERMEGWRRVGVSEDDYVHLMIRHKERTNLVESSSFSLTKYMELTELSGVEHSYFHFIVDWLSSVFKIIKPISEWPLDRALDCSFQEVIMISDKKDEDGRPRDAREVFYQAFKASIPKPPVAKKSRPCTTFF